MAVSCVLAKDYLRTILNYTMPLASRLVAAAVRTARPILFWTHLAVGVAAGAVILVMSVTGVLLTYQKQMTAWADLRDLDGAPPAASAAALPPDSLIARLRQQEPALAAAAVTSIVWRRAADAPVELVLPQGQRRFLNAYTGEVLGSGSARMRAVFRVATDWHRWLARSGPSRTTGRAITGASNIAFLLLALSGFWLWWPRTWTRATFRNVLRFRRGLSPKARDFNWHHVIGFWSLAPLVIIIASGVVISYPWASDLVYRVAGEAPPRREASREASREGSRAANDAAPSPSRAVGLERVALARELAAARMPDWRTMSVTMPRSASAPLTLTVDRGMGGEPHKRAQIVVDSLHTPPRWQGFAEQSRARRWRSLLRFAHTGEVLGVAGQTLAGLLSLGSAILVYTGLALSWRRLRAFMRRSRDRNAHHDISALL